jgi:hypothetical protein
MNWGPKDKKNILPLQHRDYAIIEKILIFKHSLKNSICSFATFQNFFDVIGHSIHLWVFFPVL